MEVVQVKYAIVGGDARSAQLAAMLAQDGHRVCAFALEKADVGEAVKTGCLQGCVYGADCVVLPVPAESGGLLNTPLSDNVLRMSEVMGALWTGQILIAGRLSDASAAQGLRAGVHMEDVMLRPEFLMGNAALTAECAIARLIDESDRALMDSAVLVCGWGRIGRLLALRLAALGAAVTVAARSRTARAEAAALGLGSVDISDHVVVQEAGGKREREVQLTDVANEVKIKTAVIHDLPVVLDLQPVFLETDMHWAVERIRSERAAYSYRWETYRKAGLVLTGGSDCPVEPFSPWLNIYTAVTRKDFNRYPDGGYQPQEKMSVYDAVCMFTKNLHYAAGHDAVLGTLEPGKFADMVVIDRDIFRIPADEIMDIQVEKTYLAGREVYSKSEVRR